MRVFVRKKRPKHESLSTVALLKMKPVEYHCGINKLCTDTLNYIPPFNKSDSLQAQTGTGINSNFTDKIMALGDD
jgi:hypothetical protein